MAPLQLVPAVYTLWLLEYKMREEGLESWLLYSWSPSVYTPWLLEYKMREEGLESWLICGCSSLFLHPLAPGKQNEGGKPGFMAPLEMAPF